MGKPTFEDVFLVKALKDFEGVERLTLVDNMFAHPTLTFLFAPSGGMKSLFALNMAVCIARGELFLGNAVQKVPVVYVDAEMSEGSVSSRVETFDCFDLPLKQFSYIVHGEEGIDLGKKHNRDLFVEWIEASDYKFIVLDNIRTLLTVGSESDAAEFSELNAFARKLRDLGCTVLVVQHANKSPNANGYYTYPGTTNQITVYDYVVGIQPTSSTHIKRLTVEKNREDVGLQTYDEQDITFSGGCFHRYDGKLDMLSAIEDFYSKVYALEIATKGEAIEFFEDVGAKLSYNEKGNRTLETVYEDAIQYNDFRPASGTFANFTNLFQLAQAARKAQRSGRLEIVDSKLEEMETLLGGGHDF